MKTGTLLIAGAVGAGLVYAVTKLRARPAEGEDAGGDRGLEFAAAFQVQPSRTGGPKAVTKDGTTYKQVDSITVSASVKNTGNILSPNLYIQVVVFSGNTIKYTSKTVVFTVTPKANPTFTFPLQGEQAYYLNGATDPPGDIQVYTSLNNSDTGAVLKSVKSGVLATITGEFSYAYDATFNISLS